MGETTQKMVAERERLDSPDHDKQRRGSATVLRLLKAGEDGFETTPANREAPAGVQRIIAAPLDRLWKTGGITQREYEAGDRYRADAYMAAIDPGAMTVDWSATGGGFSSKVPAMFTSQQLADARIRWRRIEERIPRQSVVSTVLFLALIKERSLEEIGRSVFARHDQREAAVAGHAGIRVALASLADCNGL